MNYSMAKITLICLAVFLCISSAYYQGVYVGHNFAGVEFGDICYPVIDGNCLTHLDPYLKLANLHTYINWLLFVVIIVSLAKRNLFSQTASLLCSMLIFLFFSYIYYYKRQFLNDDNHYIKLIHETISVDMIHLAAGLALVAAQTYIVAKPLNIHKNKERGMGGDL